VCLSDWFGPSILGTFFLCRSSRRFLRAAAGPNSFLRCWFTVATDRLPSSPAAGHTARDFTPAAPVPVSVGRQMLVTSQSVSQSVEPPEIKWGPEAEASEIMFWLAAYVDFLLRRFDCHTPLSVDTEIIGKSDFNGDNLIPPSNRFQHSQWFSTALFFVRLADDWSLCSKRRSYNLLS
jgi:hypothetical protein